MNNCLSKAVIFYFILVSMLIFIKPHIFFFDSNKKKLKPWNLLLHTKNINDCITIHSVIIFICILSLFVSSL
jgi:hypothetical protein